MSSTQIFTKVPSVFSFQRSLIVSAGAFFNEIEGQSETPPVYVVRHGLRGTQNVSEAGDTAKGTKDRDVSNIQQTETARLDQRQGVGRQIRSADARSGQRPFCVRFRRWQPGQAGAGKRR
ncbi:hypothetical protein [Caballeronia sp.]|uniref:hypothetical protein n=1 Tax=Caballeronia sp. TaxID=1931223 RepID=UPI003C546C94